jgi:hypothetical protein
MATLEALRDAIARVFRSWEKFPDPVLSKFRIVGVSDTAADRYTLTHVDHAEGRYHSSLLAHLEIRDGKVWILTDNTEEGIATELVAEGVPKDHIVLAFYPPALREAGEFAVA